MVFHFLKFAFLWLLMRMYIFHNSVAVFISPSVNCLFLSIAHFFSFEFLSFFFFVCLQSSLYSLNINSTSLLQISFPKICWFVYGKMEIFDLDVVKSINFFSTNRFSLATPIQNPCLNFPSNMLNIHLAAKSYLWCIKQTQIGSFLTLPSFLHLCIPLHPYRTTISPQTG